MDKILQKKVSRERRKARTRARISGTAARPRLAVFRSNRYIYAQLINDETGATVASADSRAVERPSQIDRAAETGRTIAERAAKAGISEAVFDRAGYQYQGVVAALADGAREKGLKF